MGRRSALCVLAVALVLGGSLTLSAQEGAPVYLPVDVPGTNIVFMNVRVAQPGLTLYETRALIWKRLSEAFAQAEAEGTKIDGRSIEVDLAPSGDPRILVAGRLIVAVDAAHAAINGTTQEALAEIWADRLARALDRWAEIHGT